MTDNTKTPVTDYQNALLQWTAADPEIRGLVIHRLYQEAGGFARLAKNMEDTGFVNSGTDAEYLYNRQREISETIMIAINILGRSVGHVRNRLNTRLDTD